MTDERVRFEIGFKGGGHDGWRAAARSARAPRGGAGSGGGGLIELAGDGSHWFIRTDDVAWLRRGERDRKLGFGTP